MHPIFFCNFIYTGWRGTSRRHHPHPERNPDKQRRYINEWYDQRWNAAWENNILLLKGNRECQFVSTIFYPSSLFISSSYLFQMWFSFQTYQKSAIMNFLCTPPGQRPGTAVGGERQGRAGGMLFFNYLMICAYEVQKKKLKKNCCYYSFYVSWTW